MKKKYFFGIFICLVLLCSGVFLLSFDEKVTAIPPTHAPEISNAVSRDATFVTYGRPTFGCDLSYQFTFTFRQYILGIPIDTDFHSSGSISKDKNTTVIGTVSTTSDSSKGTLRSTKFKITNISVTPWDAIVCTRYNGVEFNHTVEQDASSSPTIDIYYKGEISLNKSQGSGGSDSVSYNYYNYSINRIDLPKRTGYTFQGYYTGQNGAGIKIINANGTSTYYGNTAGNPPVRYISTLYAHWERTDCGININLKYPNGTEGYGNCGLFDITYDNGKTVSDLSNEERENGATLRLPIGKKWTIKNIRPAEGLKFDRIVCTQGLTCSNKGNGVYEFTIDKGKVNTDNDLEIDIYMQYLYKININFYKLNKSTENGGTFDLYKQPSGGSETLVGENLTNEPENPYLDNNGKFILKDIKAVENGACVKLTSANVKLKVASGKGKIEIVDNNKIIYTANSTGAGSGNGFDNEILIYTAENTLTATLKYQDGATADVQRSATYNSNGTSLPTLPSRPTRTGYGFLGWSLTPNDTGIYYTPGSDFNDVSINGKKVSDPNVKNLSFNLYAIWQANDYTVRFDSAYSNQIRYIRDSLNGGSSANGANHWLEIGAFDSNGINYALKSQGATSKNDSGIITTDYLLDGKYEDLNQWRNPGMEGGGQDYQIIDLGQLRNIEYIVVWHYYGDTRAYKDNTLEVSSDGKTWRTIFSTADTGTYTEKKNGNKVYVNAYRSKTVTYNTDYGKLPSISKTGYTFNGWYLNNTKIETNTEMTTANDHLLKSSWTVHEYNIAFDPNGGSGEMESKNDVKYDSNVTLPENAFKWAGYIFKGWNTEKNGTGTPYSDKATVKNLTSTQGTTITLYAQWEETIASDIESTFETAGTYYISTAEDLAKLIYTTENKDVGNGYTFIQTANIDLSGLTYLPIGRLNSFSATYDGQGNTISGITTYNGTDINGKYLEENSGLFANASGATIKNLIIEGANIYGQNAGIIAGSGNDGTNISNCVVSGTVNGTSIGSIIGNGNGANISVCLAKGVNTASSASGSASIDSCIYELNDTNKTRGKSSTFNKYSEWIYPPNFAYPMPKAFMWYPYPELSESSLNDWIR